MKALVFAFLSLLAISPKEISKADIPVCLNAEEDKLYKLLIDYRKSKNLPAISISAKLTKVAQAHARDLTTNYKQSDRCNFHSWSKKGDWSPCCYTSDHKQAACMWNKPKEIAGYQGKGYEIAYWSSAGANAAEALGGWKSSPGHHAVMINTGIWKEVKWQAVGIGMDGEYGVIWFGQEADDQTASVCD